MKPLENEAEALAAFKAMRQNTMMTALGIEIESVETNQISLFMPITDDVRQPMGLMHGGVSMVLAESAASMHACWGVDLTKKVPVGIEINGSHLKSAREGHVRAIGKVVRRARSLIFHQVDIYHVESGMHLCTARVTNYYKPLR